jgi:hypothetical protein
MNIQKIYNPLVTLLLRSPLHSLLSHSTALLTIVTQRSGNRLTFPVNYYLTEERSLLILTYAERAWWRNLHTSARVTLHIAGESRTGCGHALTDPYHIREKLNLMLHAHAMLRRYFDVTLYNDGTISGSARLDQALPGLIIVQVDDLHP